MVSKKNKYYNKLVKKPWGSEYLIYENKKIAAWFLNISQNKETSLHCHPLKKTGFVLLNGSVEMNVGFYRKKKLTALDKIMIRPGLFHSTKSLSKEGAQIIEIETPNKKGDLIRFKDNYGREKKPYESKKSMIELPKNYLKIHKSTKNFKFENCKFKIKKYKKILKNDLSNKKEIYAVLDGGLGQNSKNLVLSPGDIVRTDTIKKLISSFKPSPFITILSISLC
jgi:mannose-6-phosphate isomerase-like protein (cupin superfamily)